MIGKQELIINANDMVKMGMTTSPDTSDGAFSNETDAVNLLANPGVVYASALPTDKSTNLTGDIIASCEDPKQSETRLFLSSDSSQDGRFFSCNSSGTLTAIGSAYTAANFVRGKSDMIPFSGQEVYITSDSTIIRWERATDTFDGGATYPFSFTSTVATTAPHPALVYESNAYFGDGNQLWQLTSAGGTPGIVLTLASNQVIVALGIDSGTGLMMISTVDQINISGTVNSNARVLLYDGNSLKVSRAIPVNEMITAFYNLGGTIFVTYGLNLGYWTGSGAAFLRRLKNVTLNNEQLAYKHHITNISNTLYVVDGRQILAYGEVLPGRKIFYYAQYNQVSSAKYDVVVNLGNNLLGLAFVTAKFYTFDTLSVASTNTMIVYSAKYSFPRPVILRSARVEYLDSVTNGDNNRTLSVIDWIGVAHIQSLSTLQNSTGGIVYETNNIIGFQPFKINLCQFRYNTITTNFGVKRIIIYFDVVE